MSTYSVESTLVINSFMSLFNLIFTLWVSYFLSFSKNIDGEGSTENVTDLPKITASGSATIQILVMENLTTGPSCCYLTFRELALVSWTGKGSLRAQRRGETLWRDPSFGLWVSGPQKSRGRRACPFGGSR